MDSFIIPIVFGAFCVILGILNMKGNISSIHWYHRQRVTEENKMPFGRMVGLGTIMCGISMIVFGCCLFATETLKNDILMLIGVAVMIIGMLAGIILSLYAIIKYNKGIF